MPLYRYRVRNREGLSFAGDIEADSEAEAIDRLHRQDFIVTRLELNKDILSNLRHDSKGWGRVSLRDLAVFTRQLATMLNAGVAILISLRVLQQQTTNPKLRHALADVCHELEGGAAFASALQKHPTIFPEIMVNTISAGEIGGALDQVLERVADHFEKEHEIAQKFKTAMFYPSFVLVVAIGVIIFLLMVVLPNFVSMFDSMGMELPLPTRFLLGIGTLTRKYWYLILVAIMATGFSFRIWSRTDQGRHVIGQMALSLPIFGPMIRGREVSRFARTLATLTYSGVPILVALGVVEKIADNVLLKDAIRSAQMSIRAGHSIAKPLAESGVFPPMVTQMIAVGEETGQLDTLLEKVADFFDRDVKAMTERLGSVLEPLLIGFLAIVVGGIAMAVMMPIISQIQLVGY